MTIDWNSFTPITALIGGVLIGLSAAALLILNGRIAGISGILAGIFTPKSPDTGWRLAFLVGLLVAPAVYLLFAPLPEAVIEADTTTLIIAGLLVGIGTRFGSGCTSGHGVCGLSRFSLRSLIATFAFMIAGFVTVAIVR